MAINIGQFIRLIKTFERDLFSFHAYIIYIFFQLTIFSIKDLLKIVVFIMWAKQANPEIMLNVMPTRGALIVVKVLTLVIIMTAVMP